jgi:hypothetical protein
MSSSSFEPNNSLLAPLLIPFSLLREGVSLDYIIVRLAEPIPFLSFPCSYSVEGNHVVLHFPPHCNSLRDILTYLAVHPKQVEFPTNVYSSLSLPSLFFITRHFFSFLLVSSPHFPGTAAGCVSASFVCYRSPDINS